MIFRRSTPILPWWTWWWWVYVKAGQTKKWQLVEIRLFPSNRNFFINMAQTQKFTNSASLEWQLWCVYHSINSDRHHADADILFQTLQWSQHHSAVDHVNALASSAYKVTFTLCIVSSHGMSRNNLHTLIKNTLFSLYIRQHRVCHWSLICKKLSICERRSSGAIKRGMPVLWSKHQKAQTSTKAWGA